MKASLKIRENRDPLLKSKIPLKILGFPFRSSLEASRDSKELSLSFSTAFESGPVFKLNYRPNDPCRPFGLVLETGVGPFGSPVGAPISIGAEYNLLGNKSPSVFVYFKPQIGDFINKHRITSDITFPSQRPLAIAYASDSRSEALLGNNNEEQEKKSWSGMFSGRFKTAKSIIGRGEVCARTVVPVRDVAVVNLRWGVRLPAVAGEGKRGHWFTKMPYLVLNKIGIEHVEKHGEAGRKPDLQATEYGGDVVEACLGVKKELEVLRNENGLLKEDFDDFKSEIGGRQLQKHGLKKQTKEAIFEI